MRIIHLSDTHAAEPETLPQGDLLIHSGDADIINDYYLARMIDWFDWATPRFRLGSIFVPGNHDRLVQLDTTHVRNNLNTRILINESIRLEGFHIWGSPYTPTFMNWWFMKDRGQPLREHWAQIPPSTNILITHGPPFGILDKGGCRPYNNLGDEQLKERLTDINPTLHLFGHIHESYGTTQTPETRFYNAALENFDGIERSPWIIDI